MKISPVGPGLGAVATTDAPRPDIRRIKMATNASPLEGEVSEENSPIIPPSGQANADEAPKPLSPQFAALAKERRALQVMKREIEDQKKILATQHSAGIALDRIKSDPLAVLQEAGVTYDQLTAAIMANNDGVSPKVTALEAKIKALEEGVDKKLTDRDTQAEQQVLAEMKREALRLAKDGDNFEMIRVTGSVPEVMKLIERVYREQGEVLDVTEAMQLIEDELIEDSLKIANTKKVQSKLAPALPPPQPASRSGMRTLTNRDTARAVMSSKARAIAAFNGTLKR